jgi:hypothetical protein
MATSNPVKNLISVSTKPAAAQSALTKSDALANWINEAGRQGKSKPD